MLDAAIAVEVDWHDAAPDRERWHRMEAGFVVKALRKTPELDMPRTCGLMADT